MSGFRISEKFFDNSSYSTILLDKNKKILKVNEAFQRIVGYPKKEVLERQMDFFKSEMHSDKFYKKMWEIADREGVWEGEIWNRRKNGELYLATRTIILNDNHKNSEVKYVIFGRDITNEKENEQKLRNYHFKDHITNLPIKHVFDEVFASSAKQARKKKKKMALIMFDIRNFKRINNNFGFANADYILKKLTERLQNILKDNLSLCRMGSDLFLMLLPSINTDEEINKTLELISNSFKEEPFPISDQDIFLELNMGVSIFPDNGEHEQDLISKADLARYRVKENNTEFYHFYTPELNVKAFEKINLEINLRRALEQKEFILYYQPQAEIKSNKITGVEALIRWNHPEKGIIFPDNFIPLAEETGLIVPMGMWVLEEVCKQIAKWSKAGFNLTIGVNLSPLQFQDRNLVSDVKRILEETKINPNLLEIEITEGMMIIDIQKTIQIMSELKNMGVKISIDDFGTGYSSLNYLAQLPINFLKIDRSFLLNLHKGEHNETIISSMIALAKGLNLSVVAEGVETNEHLEFLKEIGCDYMQGYFLSKPLPLKEIEKIISNYNKKTD